MEHISFTIHTTCTHIYIYTYNKKTTSVWKNDWKKNNIENNTLNVTYVNVAREKKMGIKAAATTRKEEEKKI